MLTLIFGIILITLIIGVVLVTFLAILGYSKSVNLVWLWPLVFIYIILEKFFRILWWILDEIYSILHD